MRNAIVELARNVTTGELTEIERLPVSSEGGHWKSTRTGNSLVAYPTAGVVLRGLGGCEPTWLPGGWQPQLALIFKDICLSTRS